MRSSALTKALGIAAIAAGILTLLLTAAPVDAQGVSSQLIAQYLDRAGLSWKPDAKNANSFHVTKTSGLKKANGIEMVIFYDEKQQIVTLRAFPQLGGKWLSLAAAKDQAGLAKAILQKNSTAFGAWFVDESGDIGFRFVFTTEAGLGYAAFKTVALALLQIADEPTVNLYNSYR